MLNIKEGFDHPVSVTKAIIRPLQAFVKTFIGLFCITLCILTVFNETIGCIPFIASLFLYYTF